MQIVKHSSFGQFLSYIEQHAPVRALMLQKILIVSVAVICIVSGWDYCDKYGFSISSLLDLKMSITWIVSTVAMAVLMAVLVVGIEEYRYWKRKDEKREEM
jgi:TRAP-type C4-dicarboxylate transport system permease small subunit